MEMKEFIEAKNLEEAKAIQDTKLRIMAVAKFLMAAKGINGTSIRDIAGEADSNISAINYHFGSKDNLLLEITKCSYQALAQSIKDIYESKKQWKTADLAVEVLKKMMENPESMVVLFKIMMNEEFRKFGLPTDLESDDATIGPPGGSILLDCINKEVGNKIDLDSKIWAIQVLFSYISHKSLICSTIYHGMSQKTPVEKYFRSEYLEASVRRLTKSLLSEIQR